MQSYTVFNRTTQTQIATRMPLANTAPTRRVGLLKHERLEIGHGLTISGRKWLPLMAIHTVGMKFSIDVFFLDHRKHVLEICTLAPNRVKCVFGARWVLETAEGTIVSTRTQRGDQVELTENL